MAHKDVVAMKKNLQTFFEGGGGGGGGGGRGEGEVMAGEGR